MKKLLFHVKKTVFKKDVNYLEFVGHILYVTILLSLVWYAGSSVNPLFYIAAFLLFYMYILLFCPPGETDDQLNSRLEKERKFIAMEKIYNSLNNILNNSESNQLMKKTIYDQYPKILKLVCGIDTEVKIINNLEEKVKNEY